LDKSTGGRRFHNAGQLGPALPKGAYARAGFSKLKEYVLAAQKLGIVTVTFGPDVMWIALNIAKATATMESKDRVAVHNSPAWIASYLHEKDEPRTVGLPLSPPITLV
jgi:hypothetical protein